MKGRNLYYALLLAEAALVGWAVYASATAKVQPWAVRKKIGKD